MFGPGMVLREIHRIRRHAKDLAQKIDQAPRQLTVVGFAEDFFFHRRVYKSGYRKGAPARLAKEPLAVTALFAIVFAVRLFFESGVRNLSGWSDRSRQALRVDLSRRREQSAPLCRDS